jgi:HAD superfamily hydrolase (TIGR01509 family)
MCVRGRIGPDQRRLGGLAVLWVARQRDGDAWHTRCVPVDRVDLDSLIGAWHSAFRAAQEALRTASLDHDMDGAELGLRSRRLSDERADVVRALGSFVHDRYARPRLVRLLGSTVEVRTLLGLPAHVDACVFSVEGVLVASAEIQAEAWKETFDPLISSRVERDGLPYVSFSRRIDYPTLIQGRSRQDAVRVFLESRGISLPEGQPDDPPDRNTVHGLANRKELAITRRLERHGVRAFDGARLFLELAHDAHVSCAVVSGSTHTQALLARANLVDLVDGCIDGNAIRRRHLRRKPAPDMHLAACELLGVAPARTAVFETTREGVIAGRQGGFALVVSVDHNSTAAAPRSDRADRVVTDLGEILELGLGGAGMRA